MKASLDSLEMYNIQFYLNWAMEHTYSSSEEEDDEEETLKRNWLDFPPDVLSLIFMKVGTIDILVSARLVCPSWRKLSKQPHLFPSIHVELVSCLFGRFVDWFYSYTLSRVLAREAIDRSCGQLVEISIQTIHDDELLHYMSQKSSSLRSLRLVSDEDDFTDDGLIEMAKKLPHLEVLEIIRSSYFPKDVIETFGSFCPQLKSCRLNYKSYFWHRVELDGVALAIAENLSELCHLNLFGDKVTDDGLRAILDGCPHLESLDLRRCFNVKFAEDLKERCGNMKVLRLPNDSTDDFEYEQFW